MEDLETPCIAQLGNFRRAMDIYGHLWTSMDIMLSHFKQTLKVWSWRSLKVELGRREAIASISVGHAGGGSK